MATSARLNIPVRRTPIPSLTKSVTAPLLKMRSIRFPAPPPANSDSPINSIESSLSTRTMYPSMSSKPTLEKTTNSRKRLSLGRFDPNPSSTPVFSTYSNRTKSFSREMGGEEANDSLAMSFVTWSQPAQDSSIKMARLSLHLRFMLPCSPVLMLVKTSVTHLR